MTEKSHETPKRILMADDSVLTRSVLKKHLAGIFPEAGVIEVSNGSEAIKAFKKSCYDGKRFDIIMLDYMMPEKTGLEVLKLIRETDTVVPIYIVTANFQNATRNKALELGCTKFLKKNLKAEDLQAALTDGGAE